MPSKSAIPVSTQENEEPYRFAEKEYVSTRRALNILGVSETTLSRLASGGRIRWLNYKRGSWKRVHYRSLVEFCDRLRKQHKIADRRPPLAPNMRHRDEDVLPFPLADTISAAEACAMLGYTKTESLVPLIEEGCFEAYQMAQLAPWRISRSSLLVFIRHGHPAVPTIRAEQAHLKVAGPARR